MLNVKQGEALVLRCTNDLLGTFEERKQGKKINIRNYLAKK